MEYFPNRRASRCDSSKHGRTWFRIFFTHSDSEAIRDANSKCYTNTYRSAYSNSKPDCRSYTHADPDADYNRNANSESNSNCDRKSRLRSGSDGESRSGIDLFWIDRYLSMDCGRR